jgi:peptidoglycan/xylan/chitin deacetylase (PgdA/CDA1 family)
MLKECNYVLYIPQNRLAERCYIADVVFNEYLGIAVQILPAELINWRLTDNENHRCLIMPDSFFQRARKHWLAPRSLPGTDTLPVCHAVNELPEVSLVEPKIPVIYGEPVKDGSWFQMEDERTARLGVDVLGSAFFMLTRYEELVVTDLDEHGRFPGCASSASKAGFLERPIIDEYVELLWAAMKKLWPGIERRKWIFRICPTHDVDNPFAHQQLGRLGSLRASVGDLVKRRDPVNALRRAASVVAPGPIQDTLDPNNTFEWIMNVNERYGLRSAFYFLAGGMPPYGPAYSLDKPRMRSLVKKIDSRGHEIGLHGSYDAMDDMACLTEEHQKLVSVLQEENIHLKELGGRQHYLRWSAASTWRVWATAGLDYDSSLGYADLPGFRSGTAREYPVFDLLKSERLHLRERPLIFMECSLISDKYCGLKDEAALSKIRYLVEATRRVNGTFTFLWHNSFLQRASLRRIYQLCLEA